MLSRALLLTATVIGVAHAAVTRNALFRRSTPTGVIPECQVLDVGQFPTDGTVCLSVDGDNLIVTYSPVTGYDYDKVHVWIGTEKPTETAPGQFPYTTDNGYCEIVDGGASAKCTIPLSELGDDLCSILFYIASHAELGVETGWGDGECIVDGCSPWAEYSTFEFEGCEENPPETSTAESSVAPTETSTPTETEPVPPPPTETEPAPPATTTTTEVVTLTTTTCPVSEPCRPVTCESTITATLVATVTTPCETSTYVTSGTTCVTTIAYAPVTTYVPCPPSVTPSASPVYPPANVTTPTYAPAPTAFEGGSVSLGISLGSVIALVALFGGLLL